MGGLSFLVSGLSAAYTPGDYKPDIGEGPPTDYGRPNHPNCHMEQVTNFIDKCLPYVVTTCYSQNEEECTEYHVNTCTPVVNTGVDRRCFNVTELICELSPFRLRHFRSALPFPFSSPSFLSSFLFPSSCPSSL